MRYLALIAAFLFVLAGSVWATDIWDSAADTDDVVQTDNTLWHTANPQVHDLQAIGGVADVDWYRIFPRARRSYEVQILNITGDTNLNAGGIDRTNAIGTIVLQSSTGLHPMGNESTRIFGMSWIATADSEERISVTNGSTTATSTSRYEIQYFDTTLYCPRWNQSGTQVSVLLLQRTKPFPAGNCSYTAYFYDEGMGLQGTYSSTLGVNDMDTISLANVAGLPGSKGAAQVAHDCGYGAIAAKLVALEPSTGFSFDTPCTWLPR